MDPEIEGYIQVFDYMRDEVKKAIQGMTAEELNWTPLAKDTNSAVVLVTHMAGVESVRVHQVVGGIDVHRNRDAEFAARGTSIAELEALLERVGDITRRVLSNLTSRDLAKTRSIHPEDAPISLRSAVVNAIAHIGQHLGHLTLTRQLYAARKKG